MDSKKQSYRKLASWVPWKCPKSLCGGWVGQTCKKFLTFLEPSLELKYFLWKRVIFDILNIATNSVKSSQNWQHTPYTPDISFLISGYPGFGWSSAWRRKCLLTVVISHTLAACADNCLSDNWDIFPKLSRSRTCPLNLEIQKVNLNN